MCPVTVRQLKPGAYDGFQGEAARLQRIAWFEERLLVNGIFELVERISGRTRFSVGSPA